MTQFRRIFLITAICLLGTIGITADATRDLSEKVTKDTVDGIVTVSEGANSSFGDKQVVVRVNKRGETLPAYANQITANTDGSYSVSFYLTSPGKYSLSVAVEDVEELGGCEFFFAKDSDSTDALAKINNAILDTTASVLSDTDIRKVMIDDDVRAVMDLGNLYYELEQDGADFTSVYTDIVNHDDFNSPSEFATWFKQEIFVFGLNNCSAADGSDAMSILDNHGAEVGINTWKGYTIYGTLGSTYTDEVAKRLSGKAIADFTALKSKFAEAAFLEKIHSFASNGFVNDLFVASGEEYGLDLDEYLGLTDTSTVDKGIYGQSFADIGKSQDKIDELIPDPVILGNPGGLGGGGSAGGGKVEQVIAVEGNITAPQGSVDSSKPFNDLTYVSWAEPSIMKLYNEGIISPSADKEYRPNDNITREEFVKLLVVAFKIPYTNLTSDFADVNKSDWHYPYVSAAYRNGLVNGVGEDLFGVGDDIIRMDAATMVYRFAKANGMNFGSDGESFEDSDTFADYAKESIQALKNSAIINGYNGNVFAPYRNLTRAEAAKIICGLLEVYDEN